MRTLFRYYLLKWLILVNRFFKEKIQYSFFPQIFFHFCLQIVWVGFFLAFFIHARTSFQHVLGQINSYLLIPEERKNIWRVLESNPGPHAVQATTYFDCHILGQVVLLLKISSSKKIKFQQENKIVTKIDKLSILIMFSRPKVVASSRFLWLSFTLSS